MHFTTTLFCYGRLELAHCLRHKMGRDALNEAPSGVIGHRPDSGPGGDVRGDVADHRVRWFYVNEVNVPKALSQTWSAWTSALMAKYSPTQAHDGSRS